MSGSHTNWVSISRAGWQSVHYCLVESFCGTEQLLTKVITKWKHFPRCDGQIDCSLEKGMPSGDRSLCDQRLKYVSSEITNHTAWSPRNRHSHCTISVIASVLSIRGVKEVVCFGVSIKSQHMGVWNRVCCNWVIFIFGEVCKLYRI
jgi:hypothetical protein